MTVDQAEPTRIDTEQLLNDLRERHQVPGAALGVLTLGADDSADRIDCHASGVLNLETGFAVQPDSIFQIGSITKTFTATMIMQLVEQQKLTLDQPVRDFLPSLQLGSRQATESVTLRHLLSHSSGIDGDVFTDYGRGTDAVDRYVQALAEVPQLFTPGILFSYCNAGYVLAGRVIEEVVGSSWDDALTEMVITPLGLERTGTLPEQAILGAAASGHTGKPGEPRELTRRWQLPRSIGPAGLINSSVQDVLGYVRMHLRDGTVDGTKIISAESAAGMRRKQIRQPYGHLRDGWQGLGWMVDHWDGQQVFGHNGATVGQLAYLQAYPDLGLALCLLTNGPGAGLMWAELRRALLAPYGVDAPIMITEPPAEPIEVTDPEAVIGRYGRISEQFEVRRSEAGLQIEVLPTEDAPNPDEEPETMMLIPVGDRQFVGRSDPSYPWTVYSHGTFTPDQHPGGGDYLYTGTRLTPRADPQR